MGSVLSYHPFYFLSASWTLAEAAEPVSVVVLVYSAHLSGDFHTTLVGNLPRGYHSSWLKQEYIIQ